MMKLQSSDRSLLAWIGLNLSTVAGMLLLVRLLGEVHGLIATVILLIGQSTHAYVRLGVLQKELRAMRESGQAASE
jgi:hypothetical protein